MACIYSGFHISITDLTEEIGGFKMKSKLESGYHVRSRKRVWVREEALGWGRFGSAPLQRRLNYVFLGGGGGGHGGDTPAEK